jgi:hypothetical protein
MIHWGWFVLAGFLVFWLGYFTCALMVVGRDK